MARPHKRGLHLWQKKLTVLRSFFSNRIQIAHTNVIETGWFVRILFSTQSSTEAQSNNMALTKSVRYSTRRRVIDLLGSSYRLETAGFSLTELIIVIAIVSIVLALLFPVFSVSREKSRQANCASNLRQLGLAFLQYSTDNDERLPLPGASDEYDMDQAGPYWDMADPSPGGGLNPYVKLRSSDAHPGPSIWYCPSMPQYFETPIVPPGATISFKQLTERTYVMNWYLRDPGSAPQSGASVANSAATAEVVCPNPDPATATNLYACAGQFPNPLTVSRLVAPSDTVLLFEGVPVTGSTSVGNYFGSARRSGDFSFQKGYMPAGATQKDAYSAEGIETDSWGGNTPWHNGVNETLFCDGHVAASAVKPYPWKPTAQDNQWYVTLYRLAGLYPFARRHAFVCWLG